VYIFKRFWTNAILKIQIFNFAVAGDLLRNLKLFNVMKLLQILKRYHNFILGTCLMPNLLTEEANY